MNGIPKVVFSKTLETAGWASSRIARGDLAEEIASLKREPGKDIFAHGGATFVQALSRLGLIDEYRLVIQPVALGSGLPLFKDLPAPLHLELVEAKAFPTVPSSTSITRPEAPDARTDSWPAAARCGLGRARVRVGVSGAHGIGKTTLV